MRVLVLDTEVSNLHSVLSALRVLGCRVEVIDAAPRLHRAISDAASFAGKREGDGREEQTGERLPPLIFPGVGEARSTMRSLVGRGLDRGLRCFITGGGAVLGICVGAQLLLQRSEERSAVGLGAVSGGSRLLSDRAPDGARLKVPQIGWNTVRARRSGRGGGRAGAAAAMLFRGIPQDSAFYFVHSYCLHPAVHSERIAYCDYGGHLPVAFARGRVFGVQFHPEKSGPIGLRLLHNFVRYGARQG